MEEKTLLIETCRVTEIKILKDNTSKASLLKCFEKELSAFDDNHIFTNVNIAARLKEPC